MKIKRNETSPAYRKHLMDQLVRGEDVTKEVAQMEKFLLKKFYYFCQFFNHIYYNSDEKKASTQELVYGVALSYLLLRQKHLDYLIKKRNASRDDHIKMIDQLASIGTRKNLLENIDKLTELGSNEDWRIGHYLFMIKHDFRFRFATNPIPLSAAETACGFQDIASFISQSLSTICKPSS